MSFVHICICVCYIIYRFWLAFNPLVVGKSKKVSEKPQKKKKIKRRPLNACAYLKKKKQPTAKLKASEWQATRKAFQLRRPRRADVTRLHCSALRGRFTRALQLSQDANRTHSPCRRAAFIELGATGGASDVNNVQVETVCRLCSVFGSRQAKS